MEKKRSMFLWKTSRLINSETHFSLEIAKPGEEESLKNSVHWHNYFEFEIMLSGKARHNINNESYIISRGDAHLLRYSDFHTNIPMDNEAVRLYNFNFDEAALPEPIISLILNSKEPFIYRYNEDEMKEIEADIKILLDKSSNLDNSLISALHTATFAKILLSFINKCKITDTKISKGTSALPLNQAISLIQCRFREDINLKQLALAVGLTPNHLGLLFKTQLGQSFNDYLKKVRLKHAKSLLKHSDLSIYLVSEYSGFKNTSYFIKCFKEHYGLTPRQYVASIGE